MKGGALGWRVLAQGQLLMLGLAWSVGPQALRPPALALLAALVGGGLWWLLQAPALQEEAQAALQGVRQAQAQLKKAQEQLEQQRQAAQVAALASPAHAPSTDGLGGGSWHWHRMALAAGLELQQLKPLEAPGQEMVPLQLRLRGRFHQHGAFIARLADPAQAVRLRSYQLQAGAAGLHQAELVLEHPRTFIAPPPLTRQLTRRFEAHEQADPFSEPAPAERHKTVPAPWRDVFQREAGLLERVPLSAFTLTGTLRQGEEWLALLRVDQHLHTVRAGEHLGLQRGRVQRIAELGLWWREIVQDAAGRWTEQERFWRVGESP